MFSRITLLPVLYVTHGTPLARFDAGARLMAFPAAFMGDDLGTERLVCNLVRIYVMTLGALVVNLARLRLWIVTQVAIDPGGIQVARVGRLQLHGGNLVMALDALQAKVFDVEFVRKMHIPHLRVEGDDIRHVRTGCRSAG